MIGKVILRNGAAFTLQDDGHWHTGDKEMDAYLDDRFNAREATGVAAVLPFGRGAVADAAAALDGRAEFAEELPPLPEGAVS